MVRGCLLFNTLVCLGTLALWPNVHLFVDWDLCVLALLPYCFLLLLYFSIFHFIFLFFFFFFFFFCFLLPSCFPFLFFLFFSFLFIPFSLYFVFSPFLSSIQKKKLVFVNMNKMFLRHCFSFFIFLLLLWT